MVAATVALAWNAGWIGRHPAPWDWDPSYYWAVARAIAAGRGAVTDAVWNLGWLPPTLEHPADLHWMPLPSRWIVPFLALPIAPWRAAQLSAVVAAAAWGPLGWAWARHLGLGGAVATLAGVAAGLGGGYAGYLALPDSIALYGAVGGGALLAAARGALLPTVAGVVLAALCRADGFLLGIACASAWSGGRAVLVAASGVVAAGVWLLRSVALAGPGALALRARAASALDPVAWLSPGEVPSAGLADRLGFLADHLGAIGRTWVAITLIVALPLVGIGAWRAWRSPGVRTGVGYTLLLPPALYLLAPSVAFEGSAFRSLAAAWPLLAALAILGAARLTARYAEWFLPLLTVTLLAALALAAGQAPGRFPAPLDDCAALADIPAGVPVLSYDPLGVSARCGHPGVVLGKGWSAAELDAVAARYGVDVVLTAPDGYGSWTLEAGEMRYPGWTQVGPRVWRREAE